MNESEAMQNNPFGQLESSQGQPGQNMLRVEQDRAVAETQASVALAKRFPRNQIEAADHILRACSRVKLADSALYAYPRGGTVVTGPSIRLAEAIAQNWGNFQFGVRELSQANGESTVEAFAWDLQSNTRQVKVFQVPHERHTKQGVKQLTDPRDVYEMVANQGARRLRACILGLIPGDVIDAAVNQAELTLANQGGAPEEQIKKIVKAFEAFGVTSEMIVQRLGHRLDSVISAEVLQLKKIYSSIRDGMAKAEDFFERAAEYTPAANGSGSNLTSEIKKTAKPRRKPQEKNKKAAAEQQSIVRADYMNQIAAAADIDALSIIKAEIEAMYPELLVHLEPCMSDRLSKIEAEAAASKK